MSKAVKLLWLPEALEDLERLHAFLREVSPGAATKAAKHILAGADQLQRAPHIGRPMSDETDRRELFISFAAGAYVLLYKFQDESTVIIIRVWHSREDRLI